MLRSCRKDAADGGKSEADVHSAFSMMNVRRAGRRKYVMNHRANHRAAGDGCLKPELYRRAPGSLRAALSVKLASRRPFLYQRGTVSLHLGIRHV
jgi:hypothetical protein